MADALKAAQRQADPEVWARPRYRSAGSWATLPNPEFHYSDSLAANSYHQQAPTLTVAREVSQSRSGTGLEAQEAEQPGK